MGVGDAVIAAAENTVAEDAAGTQRDLPPLLLVDDVLPDSLAGGPARFVFRVDDGEDAVPLVALADLIAEKAATATAAAAAEMAPMIYFQLKPAENIMQQAMMP